MIAVAPCHIVFVFNFGNAWVIAIYPFSDFRICAFEFDCFRIDIPVETVFWETCVECHSAVLVIATENSCESAFERYYSWIENAVGIRKKISWNYRISGIAPENIFASFRTLLPWHVREIVSLNFYWTHIWPCLYVNYLFVQLCAKIQNLSYYAVRGIRPLLLFRHMKCSIWPLGRHIL